jgi:pyruvate/2-oxoglutarate dehydrogenase complex dihydrolipoamide dehydrogenase (E3) component
MPEIENYEVLIVGGGKAGKTLGADVGKTNNCVALVERGMIGGTCVNVGCIPTKTLVQSAKVAELTARAGEFGISVGNRSTDMAGVLSRKRAVVEGFVELNRQNLTNSLGDRFILGEAQFVAPRTIKVAPANRGPERLLRGKKVFLNLGTKPALPAIPGLAAAGPLTSDSALELDDLPKHLLIIGGGYIGVELGQIFRRLGSRVTLFQRTAHLLPQEDTDLSEAVESVFNQDGIEVELNASVLSVEGKSGDQIRLTINRSDGERIFRGTHLLVATGRVPMTQGIGLNCAEVETDENGFIKVNDRLETTAADTWAMGDCAGSPQHTHVALDDYRIVKANVFDGGDRRATDRLIPHTVFIDPELGQVGLTERDAVQRGLNVKVASVPTAAVPRARTMAETRGFLKAIVDAKSDQILGFAMLGAHAGEVTSVVQMAMLGKLPFTALRDGILSHPTMAEGLNYLFNSFRPPISEKRSSHPEH